MLNVPIEIFENAVKEKKQEAFSNFLLALNERKSNKIILQSKPYILYLDPVSYCNLQCPFCETGKRKGNREGTKLPFHEFRRIIDSLGKYVFCLTLYNWGEPLLHEQLPEIIKYAKKYLMFTEVSTNLSIPLTKEWLEKLVLSGLDLIICSIDGASQETYEKYRVGGDFKLTIKNLEFLSKIKAEMKMKTPHILWRFFVFKHNQHEIKHAQKMADELGVEIKFVRPYISDFANPEEWVSTLEPYSQNIISRSDQTTEKEDEILFKTNPNFGKKPTNCSWLWSTIVINSSTSVSPCCAINFEKDDFGKLSYPIDDYMNNEKFQTARKYFNEKIPDKNVICTRCPVPTLQQAARPYNEAILNLIQKKFPKMLENISS